mgnify:FL=1
MKNEKDANKGGANVNASKNERKKRENISTPLKVHVGPIGRLDGRGDPVIGRPMPPPNWDRTIDSLPDCTLPFHWIILAGFFAWFAYLV